MSHLILATLAIGLAFNIASASIVSGLLRRPYPFPRIDDLVIVRDARPRQLHQRSPIAAGDFVDLRGASTAFAALAGWRPVSIVIGDDGPSPPEAMQGAAATADFFTVLGARPLLGRTFLDGEDVAGRDRVVVFSERVWRGRFGGDSGVVGRTIVVNGRSAVVVGIVGNADAYPSGVDAWMPMVLTPDDAAQRIVQQVSGIGRLKAGTTFDAAQADVSRIASALAATHADTNRGRGFELYPLRREQYEFTAPLFLFVQAAALLVLAVGVTNVSSLLLARAAERRQEFAIRAALGASRPRLFWTECLRVTSLTAAAGAVGTGLAFWVLALVRRAIPPDIAKWIAGWPAIHVDAASAGVAAALTLAAGAVLGGIAGAQAVLSGEGGVAGSGRAVVGGSGRLRAAIVAAQVCVSVVLLAGAAVAYRGFAGMNEAFAALRPSELVAFDLGFPAWRLPANEQLVAFEQRLETALARVGGVDALGLIGNPPASNVPSASSLFAVDGSRPLSAADAQKTDVQTVTPGAFAVLNIGLVRGRRLDASDGPASARVAVISDAFARRFLDGRDPLNAIVRLGLDPQSPGIRIVGVVANVRLNWYDPQPRPVIYLPYTQVPIRSLTVVLRSRAGVDALAPQIRASIRELDSRQPIGLIESYTAVIDASLSPVRMIGVLLAACGLAALLLASLGVYGSQARWVAMRRREFGVRLALGADRAAVARLVLRGTARIAGAGVAVSVPLAWAASAAAQNAALGLPPAGADAIAAIVAFVFAIALIASFTPAYRAGRTPPSALLRAD